MKPRLPPATLVVMALVLSPLVIGAAYAMGAALGVLGPGADTWSTTRVVRVLQARDTWQSLAWTMGVAGTATILALLLAIASMDALWRSPLARVVAALPLAVPHVAAALGILLLLGQSGLLSRVAHAAGVIHQPSAFPVLVYDRLGVGLMLSFVWKEAPFLILAALAVRARIPREMIEAARTLGGSAADAERRVVRPLVLRGVLPATCSVFAFLVGQYEMASVLGPSDPASFAVLTFERTADPALARRGEAYVLALIAFAITLALVWVYARVRRDSVLGQP